MDDAYVAYNVQIIETATNDLVRSGDGKYLSFESPTVAKDFAKMLSLARRAREEDDKRAFWEKQKLGKGEGHDVG